MQKCHVPEGMRISKKKGHFDSCYTAHSKQVSREAHCMTAHVASSHKLPAMKSQYPTQFHWTLDVLKPTPIGTTNAVYVASMNSR